MGGASQGNQGISFGARRQITSQSPTVPSFAEKERKRKEKEQEDARLKQQSEENEHKRRVESKRLRWDLDIPDDDEFGLGDEWYGSRRASIEASSGVWEDGLLVIQ